MKAPDKIYLQELNDGTWDDCFVYESSETDTKGMKRVPYIRKDALMKWLKERNYSTLSSAGYSTGHSVWEEVIDKLNSM